MRSSHGFCLALNGFGLHVSCNLFVQTITLNKYCDSCIFSRGKNQMIDTVQQSCQFTHTLPVVNKPQYIWADKTEFGLVPHLELYHGGLSTYSSKESNSSSCYSPTKLILNLTGHINKVQPVPISVSQTRTSLPFIPPHKYLHCE